MSESLWDLCGDGATSAQSGLLPSGLERNARAAVWAWLCTAGGKQWWNMHFPVSLVWPQITRWKISLNGRGIHSWSDQINREDVEAGPWTIKENVKKWISTAVTKQPQPGACFWSLAHFSECKSRRCFFLIDLWSIYGVLLSIFALILTITQAALSFVVVQTQCAQNSSQAQSQAG